MLNHGKIKYWGVNTNMTKYYKCIKQNINFFETMNISLSFILQFRFIYSVFYIFNLYLLISFWLKTVA